MLGVGETLPPGMIATATPTTRYNGMAIASLCCSVGSIEIGVMAMAGVISGTIAMGSLAWVLGIIFGHIAVQQIKRDATQGGRGMAIAGLVIGYVIVGAFALMLMAVVILVDGYGD